MVEEDRDRTIVWRPPVTNDPATGRVVEPVTPGETANVNVSQAAAPRYSTPVVAPSPVRLAVWRGQRIVYYVFGLIEAIIATRFVLKLIAANPTNPFTQAVYGVSWVFDFPFSGIVANATIGNGSVLEIFSLIAILVYLLAALAIAKLLDLLV